MEGSDGKYVYSMFIVFPMDISHSVTPDHL